MRTKQINDVLGIIRRYAKDYGMDIQDVYFDWGRGANVEIYSEDGVEVFFSTDCEYLDILGLTEEEKAEVLRRSAEVAE